ncbi:MAG: HAD family hydrolase [Oscillatoriales cyanobacterium]|uniref:HAD family hydrolase n=1 Tax=Microcoleus anatoxicus PTRS2 TaxID=2705321 RepID=A0ABU8YGX4_9CYAN|nr:MAG: HAD family hydrolase [Oscillatoriales cyanobacterium]TAD94870.1 MAG: HAD family hydrolase [Oscillatoriales cyanobacterium]TAE05227.1 MAG: HAD family hydrolase [Oscillatoriales cyanobacterium]TAF02976.1 MAG: HAD family hydrolase [Oscillatoriales cyanobacterium]TAF43445.1 MAG: HAD family hydrolase [Oscillatoriales cyanobacterium]
MVTIKCRGITFSNIQAIIFDKDGTLEDSQEFLRHLGLKRSRLVDAQIPGVGEPLQMAFGIEAGKIDPTGLMAVGSRKENEIVAAGYIAETGRGWIESLAIAKRAFDEADEMLKNSPPSPLFVGSLEVLKSLSDAGLKLGILSAATTQAVKKFVKSSELGAYIQLEMGVDSVHLNKPDPKLFLLACERLGVEPAATLMVGDSAGDIQMGKNAGAAGCIGICWGKAEASHLSQADVTIASLDEITI